MLLVLLLISRVKLITVTPTTSRTTISPTSNNALPSKTSTAYTTAPRNVCPIHVDMSLSLSDGRSSDNTTPTDGIPVLRIGPNVDPHGIFQVVVSVQSQELEENYMYVHLKHCSYEEYGVDPDRNGIQYEQFVLIENGCNKTGLVHFQNRTLENNNHDIFFVKPFSSSDKYVASFFKIACQVTICDTNTIYPYGTCLPDPECSERYEMFNVSLSSDANDNRPKSYLQSKNVSYLMKPDSKMPVS